MEEKWLRLRQDWHQSGADGAWSRHVMLVDLGFDLIRHLGNTSNLILDPAIDSYYLTEIAVNRFPAIDDHIGHFRGVGSGAAALGTLTSVVMASWSWSSKTTKRCADLRLRL